MNQKLRQFLLVTTNQRDINKCKGAQKQWCKFICHKCQASCQLSFEVVTILAAKRELGLFKNSAAHQTRFDGGNPCTGRTFWL
jgi:heterodisulfide reductase subunit C